MEPPQRTRGIVKRQHVRLEPQTAASARPEATAAERTTPAVRLLRLDDGTQALEVTCSCGDVALIEIEYETTP